MEIETKLGEIGLTKNEIKVYLALLELKTTTTGAIIKETGIHTSKVYDALERLLKKGLVSYILISNVKHFKTAPVERLLDFMDAKKQKINQQKESLKKILPELKEFQKIIEEETEAEIFSGWKGMETAYRMMRNKLKKGDINYVVGASKGENSEQVKTFFNKHLVDLAKKRIKQRIIYNKDARKNIEEQYKHPDLFQVRYMKDTTSSEINIWGDKVMIVILTKNPKIILISGKGVADSYVSFFNMLWKLAKP